MPPKDPHQSSASSVVEEQPEAFPVFPKDAGAVSAQRSHVIKPPHIAPKVPSTEESLIAVEADRQPDVAVHDGHEAAPSVQSQDPGSTWLTPEEQAAKSYLEATYPFLLNERMIRLLTRAFHPPGEEKAADQLSRGFWLAAQTLEYPDKRRASGIIVRRNDSGHINELPLEKAGTRLYANLTEAWQAISLYALKILASIAAVEEKAGNDTSLTDLNAYYPGAMSLAIKEVMGGDCGLPNLNTSDLAALAKGKLSVEQINKSEIQVVDELHFNLPSTITSFELSDQERRFFDQVAAGLPVAEAKEAVLSTPATVVSPSSLVAASVAEGSAPSPVQAAGNAEVKLIQVPIEALAPKIQSLAIVPISESNPQSTQLTKDLARDTSINGQSFPVYQAAHPDTTIAAWLAQQSAQITHPDWPAFCHGYSQDPTYFFSRAIGGLTQNKLAVHLDGLNKDIQISVDAWQQHEPIRITVQMTLTVINPGHEYPLSLAFDAGLLNVPQEKIRATCAYMFDPQYNRFQLVEMSVDNPELVAILQGRTQLFKAPPQNPEQRVLYTQAKQSFEEEQRRNAYAQQQLTQLQKGSEDLVAQVQAHQPVDEKVLALLTQLEQALNGHLPGSDGLGSHELMERRFEAVRKILSVPIHIAQMMQVPPEIRSRFFALSSQFLAINVSARVGGSLPRHMQCLLGLFRNPQFAPSRQALACVAFHQHIEVAVISTLASGTPLQKSMVAFSEMSLRFLSAVPDEHVTAVAHFYQNLCDYLSHAADSKKAPHELVAEVLAMQPPPQQGDSTYSTYIAARTFSLMHASMSEVPPNPENLEVAMRRFQDVATQRTAPKELADVCQGLLFVSGIPVFQAQAVSCANVQELFTALTELGLGAAHPNLPEIGVTVFDFVSNTAARLSSPEAGADDLLPALIQRITEAKVPEEQRNQLMQVAENLDSGASRTYGGISYAMTQLASAMHYVKTQEQAEARQQKILQDIQELAGPDAATTQANFAELKPLFSELKRVAEQLKEAELTKEEFHALLPPHVPPVFQAELNAAARAKEQKQKQQESKQASSAGEQKTVTTSGSAEPPAAVEHSASGAATSSAATKEQKWEKPQRQLLAAAKEIYSAEQKFREQMFKFDSIAKRLLSQEPPLTTEAQSKEIQNYLAPYQNFGSGSFPPFEQKAFDPQEFATRFSDDPNAIIGTMCQAVTAYIEQVRGNFRDVQINQRRFQIYVEGAEAFSAAFTRAAGAPLLRFATNPPQRLTQYNMALKECLKFAQEARAEGGNISEEKIAQIENTFAHMQAATSEINQIQRNFELTRATGGNTILTRILIYLGIKGASYVAPEIAALFVSAIQRGFSSKEICRLMKEEVKLEAGAKVIINEHLAARVKSEYYLTQIQHPKIRALLRSHLEGDDTEQEKDKEKEKEIEVKDQMPASAKIRRSASLPSRPSASAQQRPIVSRAKTTPLASSGPSDSPPSPRLKALSGGTLAAITKLNRAVVAAQNPDHDTQSVIAALRQFGVETESSQVADILGLEKPVLAETSAEAMQRLEKECAEKSEQAAKLTAELEGAIANVHSGVSSDEVDALRERVRELSASIERTLNEIEEYAPYYRASGSPQVYHQLELSLAMLQDAGTQLSLKRNIRRFWTSLAAVHPGTQAPAMMRQLTQSLGLRRFPQESDAQLAGRIIKHLARIGNLQGRLDNLETTHAANLHHFRDNVSGLEKTNPEFCQAALSQLQARQAFIAKYRERLDQAQQKAIEVAGTLDAHIAATRVVAAAPKSPQPGTLRRILTSFTSGRGKKPTSASTTTSAIRNSLSAVSSAQPSHASFDAKLSPEVVAALTAVGVTPPPSDHNHSGPTVPSTLIASSVQNKSTQPGSIVAMLAQAGYGLPAGIGPVRPVRQEKSITAKEMRARTQQNAEFGARVRQEYASRVSQAQAAPSASAPEVAAAVSSAPAQEEKNFELLRQQFDDGQVANTLTALGVVPLPSSQHNAELASQITQNIRAGAEPQELAGLLQQYGFSLPQGGAADYQQLAGQVQQIYKDLGQVRTASLVGKAMPFVGLAAAGVIAALTGVALTGVAIAGAAVLTKKLFMSRQEQQQPSSSKPSQAGLFGRSAQQQPPKGQLPEVMATGGLSAAEQRVVQGADDGHQPSSMTMS